MFQGTSDTLEEVGAMLVEKLPVFIQSGDLEVQERACCILQVSSTLHDCTYMCIQFWWCFERGVLVLK